MVRYIELNHALADGMEAYPGLGNIEIGAHLDHERSRPNYDDKAEFYIGKISMVTNAGTYIDSPFHRHRDGADLSRIPLEKVAGIEGIVLDRKDSVGGPSNRPLNFVVDQSELTGRAVLIRTGLDGFWGEKKYLEEVPYLSREFVDLLISAKAALVGVDFLNVDDTTDKSRPVHTRLLKNEILIVENLRNLGGLPRDGFRFSAVPLRIVRGASFPVRAFAEVND
ncbi:MAG: cyclase family protein [Deltaproteobacteria bacterium]|uniref:Cyclase family protein n=1 Tax=Candidatus Zymogenus saltonus TaxID=2844893 RepID=A0A9D8KEN7_9DELT|nr:cyclase family protein [Candidatus Zymogenus saltonus]